MEGKTFEETIVEAMKLIGEPCNINLILSKINENRNWSQKEKNKVSATLSKMYKKEKVLRFGKKRKYVKNGYHSSLMKNVGEGFSEYLQGCELKKPSEPLFISNLSGKIVEESEVANADYWRRHIVERVEFGSSIEHILESYEKVMFVEVGPSNFLSKLVRHHGLDSEKHSVVTMMRHPHQKIDDSLLLYRGIGYLWNRKVNVDWESFNENKQGMKISLPGYSFERTYCWVEPSGYVTFESEKMKMKRLMKGLNSKYGKEASTCNIKNVKNIFVTGVTGFIGKELLSKMLEEYDESVQIHCFVRESSVKKLEGIKNSRVHIVVGDLCKRNLGLSEKEFECLSEQVDMIYHCAAQLPKMYQSSSLGGYDDYYDANVGSIFEIVKLARGYKPLVLLSTMEVHSSCVVENLEDEEHERRRGYGSSKWVADCLIHNFYKNFIIFRVPLVQEPTYKTERNLLRKMIFMLPYLCQEMKMIPDSICESSIWSVIPSDDFAGNVVKESMKMNVGTINIGGGSMLINDMCKRVEELSSESWKVVGLDEWMKHVSKEYDLEEKTKYFVFAFLKSPRFSDLKERLKECEILEFGQIDDEYILESVRMASTSVGISEIEMTDTKEEIRDIDLASVLDIVSRVWNEVLSVESLDHDSNYFEIGGDSFSADVICQKLQSEMGIKVPMKLLYENPTVDQLANELVVVSKAVSSRLLKEQGALGELRRKSARYPLSSSQRSMIILNELQGDSAVYRLGGQFKFSDLNFKLFEESLKRITQRHEILRTNFVLEDGEYYQKVNHSERVDLQFIDLSNEKEPEKYIRFHLKRNMKVKMDLSSDILFKSFVYGMGGNDFVISFDFHHIVTDFVSHNVFFHELFTVYNCLKKGKEPELGKVELHYGDFAVWQDEYLKSSDFLNNLEKWKTLLVDVPESVELPTLIPRGMKKSNAGRRKSRELSSGLDSSIRKICGEYQTTPYMVLLSSFQMLLYKYSRQKVFNIGLPFKNRSLKNSENIIGFFVNVLPVPVEVIPTKGWDYHVKALQDVYLELLSIQDVPFETIVSSLDVTRNSMSNPLFNVCVNYLPSTEKSMFDSEANESVFEMYVIINDTHRGFAINIDYSTELYSEEMIESMLDRYEILLNRIVENPDKPIGMHSLLTEEEFHRIAYEWNDTKGDYPDDKTAVEVFEDIVSKQGELNAVEFKEESLTFDEYNAKSNQVAHYLRSKHSIGAEQFVGICVEKSIGLMVCVMGVLKSGGVYLPLDFKFPEDRLRHYTDDTKCSVIIINKKYREQFEFFDGGLLIYEDIVESFEKESIENPVNLINNRNLAYVIYTSGSTGKPKGVLIEHRSLVNQALVLCDIFDIRAGDVSGLFSNISFDGHIGEVFWALLNGQTLRVYAEESRRDSTILMEDMVTL